MDRNDLPGAVGFIGSSLDDAGYVVTLPYFVREARLVFSEARLERLALLEYQALKFPKLKLECLELMNVVLQGGFTGGLSRMAVLGRVYCMQSKIQRRATPGFSY